MQTLILSLGCTPGMPAGSSEDSASAMDSGTVPGGLRTNEARTPGGPKAGSCTRLEGRLTRDTRDEAGEVMERRGRDRLRALGGELLGTGALALAVVGSGITAEQACGGNAGLALLVNALATAGALHALILALGPVSGAHFNPAVTLLDAIAGALPWRDVGGRVLAQIVGGVGGVVLTHAMYALPLAQLSTHARTGRAFWLSEGVATFGLLGIIHGVSRARPERVAPAVAGWILGAYWFTSSTSFANPALTLARTLTDTYAGIAPASAPAFLLAQGVGALLAWRVFHRRAAPTPDPHTETRS